MSAMDSKVLAELEKIDPEEAKAYREQIQEEEAEIDLEKIESGFFEEEEIEF